MKCAADKGDAEEEVEGGEVMPQGDRTGTPGMGPKTGKGKGACNPSKGDVQPGGQRGMGSGKGSGQGQGGGSGRGQGQGRNQGRGSGSGRGNR